jgi:hypothetical protein
MRLAVVKVLDELVAPRREHEQRQALARGRDADRVVGQRSLDEDEVGSRRADVRQERGVEPAESTARGVPVGNGVRRQRLSQVFAVDVGLGLELGRGRHQ